jgi:hypothetical protein
MNVLEISMPNNAPSHRPALTQGRACYRILFYLPQPAATILITEYKMAKNNGNLFLNRFSGMVGDQMVLRKGKDGRTIMCAKPNYVENRTYSQAQLAQQKAFRDAITYAKVAKEQEVYKLKANGGPKSPFNVAVADWFKEPQVLGIDLSGWNGAGRGSGAGAGAGRRAGEARHRPLQRRERRHPGRRRCHGPGNPVVGIYHPQQP